LLCLETEHYTLIGTTLFLLQIVQIVIPVSEAPQKTLGDSFLQVIVHPSLLPDWVWG
jgi:hypothetical protein